MEKIEACFPEESLDRVLHRWPDATAVILGSSRYSQINGIVRLYQMGCGVIVATEISGLPTGENVCGNSVFGFHIHEGDGCQGTMQQPFERARGHYNPMNCEHPQHAGDLPPLFGNNGYALSVFLTNRFSVLEVIGRTVIVHLRPDDFVTQPSGNSGEMIACGVIRKGALMER